MKTAFIIGGTGQIGIATAQRLLAEGWNVTLAHRGKREARNVPDGARLVAVDGKNEAELAAAIGHVDLLVDCMAFNAADADRLIALRTGYDRLVVISSASVYEDENGRSIETGGTTGLPDFDGPRRETDSTVAPGMPNYSSGKMELETRLRDADLPVALIRPCAIHGINSPHPREWWFVKRMLDGRRHIPLLDGGATRFHTSATANIAAVISTAAGVAGPITLNAGDPAAPTVREIGETLAAALEWDGEFVSVANDSPLGHTPWSVPHDFTVSMAAAEAVGYRPAGTYAETIRPYVAWMKANVAEWKTAFPMFQHYPADPFDYVAEDAGT